MQKTWDKSAKKFVYIPPLEVVQLYNSCMGEVDKLDFLVSINGTFMKNRKWTLRIFTNVIELACTNSWLEYKSKCTTVEISKKKIYEFLI